VFRKGNIKLFCLNFRFVLGLFVVVIAVLVILYIKHRTKERSRARRRRSKYTDALVLKLHCGVPLGTSFKKKRQKSVITTKSYWF
jgi:uncharacterized membrane protein YidH (DUF202 family)